jgi:hypothetical protein
MGTFLRLCATADGYPTLVTYLDTRPVPDPR